MQRIGMIGSVGAVEDMSRALTMGRDFKSPYRTVLLDLSTAIADYHSGKGSLDTIQARLKRANEGVSAYIAAFPGNAREGLKEQRQYAVDQVNKSVVDYLRDRNVLGPYGRVHLDDVGRLVFRRPGEATAKAAYNVKQSTSKAVTAVKSKLKKKEAGASGFGDDSGPLLFTVMGAGVGYAVSRKNRGMSAGVGALVGFLAARYFSTPATPGAGYVGAVADVVTEFSTTLADNGYSVSAPRESTVIVDDNRFDGSAITVLHPPEKAALVANLARAKASKYGIDTAARGAVQVKPTDGGSVVIFADV